MMIRHRYKPEIRGHVINGRTWASVQRLADSEVLNIWMRTPKRRVPKVLVKMDDESDSAGAEHTDDESRHGSQTFAAAVAEFMPLNPAPMVSAFLEWRILDEFGEPEFVRSTRSSTGSSTPFTDLFQHFVTAQKWTSLLTVQGY